MRRVMVTGGAGFLGSAVVEALAQRGDPVLAVDMAVNPRLTALAEAHPGTVQAVTGEVTEWARMAVLVQDFVPEAIVHCAAVVGVPASVQAPQRTMQVNVGGSLNLLELMRLYDVPRMVHLSSEETYGPFQGERATEDHPQHPLMPYGVSKLAVEHLARSYVALYGLECIHLRTSWVYGPGLPRPRVPKTLVEAAVAGQALHLPSGGDFAVDHTHVADAVQGVLLALDHAEHQHDAYNIGSGQAPTLREIVGILQELVPGAELSVGPGPLPHPGGVPVVPKGALDVTRARETMGYEPRYDIRRGLTEYVAALQSHTN